jgi:hypothetical protein
MDRSGKRAEKRWYRKAQVAERYGVSGRTIERAVQDGRLPPPKYPLGDKFPYWDGDDLDAHDHDLLIAAKPAVNSDGSAFPPTSSTWARCRASSSRSTRT